MGVWFVLLVTTTASACCLASAALADSTSSSSAEKSSDEQEGDPPSTPPNWKTRLGEHRKNLLHAFQNVPRIMTCGGTRRQNRLTKQKEKEIKFLVASAAPSAPSPSVPVMIQEKNVAVQEHSSCRRMAQVCDKDKVAITPDVVQILGENANAFTPEPYVGMVLRAFNVESCLGASGKSSLADCGVGNDDHSDLSAFYELLEPVQLELGVRPKHWLDFAYKPVLTEGRQGWKSPSPSSGSSSPSAATSSKLHAIDCEESTALDAAEVCLEPVSTNRVASPRSSLDAWWQWWFIFMGLRPSSRRNAEEKYEKTGERAFAGGSHGEVWRGRRKCHVVDVDEHEQCDGTRPLILKRLKVEYGVKLLEAGLREIYFGHILASDENEQLFTKYVDHFFRESSVPFRAKKELELWIVFEDAGSSLRSYLYTPLTSGGFVLYQHSAIWKSLRMSQSRKHDKEEMTKSVSVNIREVPRTKQQRWNPFYRGERRQRVETGSVNSTVGRLLMREVLRQLLESAAYLHSHGIVHRDIKPSNFMCKTGGLNLLNVLELDDSATIDLTMIRCVLGDFSSAWDEFADQNLYSGGLSSAEQTIEYAPPEAMLGPSWIPFVASKPESYDSWSIGVVALELLLGTPNVFSVDQRTTALLSNKMRKQGAPEEEIDRALYLAALSQFCIYMPEEHKTTGVRQPGWPLRYMQKSVMTKQSCTMHDFHRALRARDPLGLGFDSSADTLLHLIWSLLTWDPMERSTATEALRHPYFTVDDFQEQSLKSKGHKALESLMLDPRVDFKNNDVVAEFTCPKCGRKFDDWRSCHTHARSRRHANFCDYNRTELPTCLNAHTLLPAHPLSGYCDIQGRRRTIEDFHTVHLNDTHQFFGVFDGHTGNLAPKYAASMFPDLVHQTLSAVDADGENWKEDVKKGMEKVFSVVHENLLNIVASSPVETMDQSGTTASVVYLTDDYVVVSSVGDSRTILSTMSSSKRVRSIPLTKDHVASDSEEQELVVSRGGFVSAKGGLQRVNGTLAITRSIGDAALAPVLSRMPAVVAMSRRELKEQCGFELSDLPCFIIQASDGLWDVMENDEAVEMVIDIILSFEETTGDGTAWFEGGAVQESAERLTQEAYVRGSTDNIGVSVIAIT